jgi:threonine efflux protein
MALPFAQFLPVWGFLAVTIAMPGPNVLNTIATAMGSGRAAGLASAAAVGLGVAMWCLGMALGMAAVFALLPVARQLLTFVAVCLLLWYSLQYFRAAWTGYHRQRRLPGEDRLLSPLASFRRSLLVNVMNPKALTSWLAILTFFPVAQAGAVDILLLGAGACAIAFGMHTAYALAFSAPAAARIYLRAGWAISGIAGLFFAVFALRLMLTLTNHGA